MKVAVFGLGYIGVVNAVCLARDGHQVVGVEVDPRKLQRLHRGCAPVVEPGLDVLFSDALEAGRLEITDDPRCAVRDAELSLICVGTPTTEDGGACLDALARVCDEIGAALAARGGDRVHVVAVRSTVPPGTVEGVVVPRLERAWGGRVGDGLGVCMHPEFLREGHAIGDHSGDGPIVIGDLQPDATNIGHSACSGNPNGSREHGMGRTGDCRNPDAPCSNASNPGRLDNGGMGRQAGNVVARLYAGREEQIVRVNVRVAELIKYAHNAFHAIKVAFANELGTLASASGVDGQEIMELFCRDTALSPSAAYLRPGPTFGGACLPKDLRALLDHAKRSDLELPLIASVEPSNNEHLLRCQRLVEAAEGRRVGIIGVAFKTHTDDLRESPALLLARRLIDRGYQVRFFDDGVDLGDLFGANRVFLDSTLPEAHKLAAASLAALLDAADILVL